MSNNEIGYKKPPKHTQFQPGKSGNPSGRPKKANVASGADIFNMPVTVTQKGKSKTMPAIDAILTQTVGDALAGDPKARKLALDLYGKWTGGSIPGSSVDQTAKRSPFEISPEDRANIAKSNLLKGVK